METENP